MPPAVSRFGPQVMSGSFTHIQQSHLSHHNQQHQPPGSSGLPPPSFSSHHAFTQGNPNNNISPFAPSVNGNGLAGGFGSGNGLSGGGTGLASHAAVMGFAHGAALQQQQQARDALRRSSGGTGSGKGHAKGRIRDVWRSNLSQEMQVLRGLVDKYPYISMVCRNQSWQYRISQQPQETTNEAHRTPSFRESWHDLWAPSPRRRIIITKRFDVMWIFSE